jgi:hypothetical protein
MFSKQSNPWKQVLTCLLLIYICLLQFVEGQGAFSFAIATKIVDWGNVTPPAVAIPPPPKERVFTIPDDTCAEYYVPANYTNPLIYDYELEYYTRADGTKAARWKELDTLRLPVFCLTASSAPISGITTPAGGSIQASTFSLGSGFLKGSILAVQVLANASA